MSPSPGSIHRQPRSDSGAARLWLWARQRSGAWTCAEGAEAADITPRRCRAIVRALADAGLLACEADADPLAGESARWSLSAAGRALERPPLLVIDEGQIAGVRTSSDGAGNDRLRKLLDGWPKRDAAKRLKVNDRTLRRMLSGALPIAADDPILSRAAKL